MVKENGKVKCKFSPIHARKAYGGSGGMAPLILNLTIH
jgi:hypothetical protein